MPQMQPYVVCQGDHLKAIADARGFDPDAVWNDPTNAAIKAQRGTYNVLAPGDVVYVPAPSPKYTALATGQENNFTSTPATITITHAFFADDQPLANAAFKVLDGVDPDPTQPLAPPGSTDGDGKAKFEVPARTTRVWLAFDGGQTFVLAVGHLDPASTPSGCAQRLTHLGYLDQLGTDGQGTPDPDDPDDDTAQWIALALTAFQHDNGLPETGELDDASSAKLVEKYGA